MKIIKWGGVLLLGCVLFCRCVQQDSEKGIPVIDLSKSESTVNLKLSDLVDNIRIIPLETRPDILLPGFFYAWIGNKYIVTIGQNEIHLFTIDGKYVRKLAQQGRGPEEYLYVLGYCVDEEENYCYLADGNSHICVIDLNEGKMVRKIPTSKNIPYKLLYTKDNTLAYIPMREVKDSVIYDVCYISLDGTLLNAVKGNSKSFGAGIPYLGEMNDTLCYKMVLGDTLFKLVDTIQIPYCRLLTERPYSIASGEGRTVEVIFENKDRFILANTEMKVKAEGKEFYTMAQFLGHYTFEKSDFTLKKVSGFYIDAFDYTDTERFPLLVAGNKAYRNFNVLRFKEMLKDKLDSPLIAESLKKLYHKLKDEDNPVLLVGDIKK